jgi:hypothetical protein
MTYADDFLYIYYVLSAGPLTYRLRWYRTNLVWFPNILPAPKPFSPRPDFELQAKSAKLTLWLYPHCLSTPR